MTLRVSDHALMRLLERSGGLDLEGLRASLTASFQKTHAAVEAIGVENYVIKADGLVYVVRGGTMTTVLDDDRPRHIAGALRHDPAGRA